MDYIFVYMGVIANTYGLLTSANNGHIIANQQSVDRYTRTCYNYMQLSCVRDYYSDTHNISINIGRPTQKQYVLQYTRERLYNIRRSTKHRPTYKPSDEVMKNIKNLGIFQYRGCRGGKYKQRNITVITTTRRIPETLQLGFLAPEF